MSIMPVESVTAAPLVTQAVSPIDYAVTGPSGLLVQSYAAAVAAGVALALPPPPANGLPILPTPPPIAPVSAIASYGGIDVYA
jgi:hypothetical protein